MAARSADVQKNSMALTLPQLEQRILTAVKPTDLPRLTRDEILTGTSDGIYVSGADKPRTYNRYAAVFVDDPEQVGLFPDGIGVACYDYAPVFTAVVRDAVLCGYRTLLTSDGRFFSDEGYVNDGLFEGQLRRLSRPDEFSNEMTGLAPTGEHGRFRLNTNGRSQQRLEGAVTVLCSDEPLSYGSFLFRVVPKVVGLRELDLLDAPCLAYAHQKPFMDLLNLCGIPCERIVLQDLRGLTSIERAIVPCMRAQHTYFDSESVELFAELRTRYGRPRSHRRIYVSRLGLNTGGWSTRIMVNEAELITRLSALGFDIIEPERLAVREQIETFSSASMVVGPSGSGLFNTVFCHPGTRIIDIQSEPHWIYSYTGMYSSLGLSYGIFIGKPDAQDRAPVHRRWSVNIHALLQRIAGFSQD
jgi:capsular polysaccharide biosynthesis protein